MPVSENSSTQNNRLLAALPEKEYRLLLPDLEEIALNFGENLYLPGERIKSIYFPISGIISLISLLDEKSMLEVGVVGREGMIGLPIFLGAKTSNLRAVVQGGGSAWRINAADFLDACQDGSELPRLLKLYTQLLFAQTARSAACNVYHPIESRLARWLLMSHDRVKTAQFRLTHEFLSTMLGVRREAVTLSAQRLQQLNLIEYSRGIIKILDRQRLENAACTCYAVINREEESFFH